MLGRTSSIKVKVPVKAVSWVHSKVFLAKDLACLALVEDMPRITALNPVTCVIPDVTKSLKPKPHAILALVETTTLTLDSPSAENANLENTSISPNLCVATCAHQAPFRTRQAKKPARTA